MSVCVTAGIGFIGLYFVQRQVRLDGFRLRHESYERRLGVYKAVQAFLVDILQAADADHRRIRQFYAEASEAVFLFDSEVQDYIDLLRSKAIEMHKLYEQLYSSSGRTVMSVGEERSKVVDQNTELVNWFGDQLSESKRLFRKHMAIE